MATKTANRKSDLRNAKVKALRPHSNQHGEKYAKVKDDTYVHPRPRADIDAGLVELVQETPKKA